ncbi:MAG: glycosyltransferase family 2 protein [Chloroflexi bacterium]|nr:glycosyltransferase family 2 protein [Chloroflexota bacterium]
MISIVIPVHNAVHTLEECLQAIQGSDYTDYEVIVVDDASVDGSAEVARKYACRLIPLSENVGAARAKNIGAKEARGDIILFTDADVVLQPDTLRIVAEHFRDPTVAGVVGLLDEKLRYSNFSSHFKNLWMHYTYKRLAESEEAERGVGVFLTSIAAIRKEVFEQMGGFDPNYRGASVTEDIEFGQRLLSAGHKIRLDNRLAVEHLKHYSLRGLLRTDFERAFGLTKTWLRKKFDPALRGRGQRYYASVPWFFMLGVPLAWLLPGFVLLALWKRQFIWGLVACCTYVAILLVNAPFLNALRRARGWFFGLQSCLFLPIDLWISGLGVLWAVIDYLRGNRY